MDLAKEETTGPTEDEKPFDEQEIVRFAGELSDGLGKVRSKFVRDMLVGIHQSRSVNLTEIARSLGEGIELHASHKRLSRNLARSELIDVVGDRLLAMGAAQVTDSSLLIVHCYNLVKRFATKMEYLCDDESEGVGLSSYQVCEIVAYDAEDRDRYTSLSMHLWSRLDPNYESDEVEVQQAIDRVERATEGRGTFYLRTMRDMPLWSQAEDHVVQYALQNSDCRLVTSVYEGEFLADDQLYSTADLIAGTELPFGKMMFKYVPPGVLDDNLAMELALFVDFGSRCIQIPGSDVPLTLVVTQFKHQESNVHNREQGEAVMAFLVRGHVTDREALWPLVRDFHSVIDAVNAESNHRSEFNLSDFRVLTYDRLRLLTTFLEAVMYYETVIAGNVRIDVPRLTQNPHKGDHIRDFLLPPDAGRVESA